MAEYASIDGVYGAHLSKARIGRLPYGRRAPLIGLIGYARSGKDTVAARLVSEHGYTRFAFADALRASALALNPIIVSGEQCAGIEDLRLRDIIDAYGWEDAKDRVPEVRRVLQNMGVGVRDLDEDFWVNVVTRQLDAAPTTPAVITDVRFPNELDAIRRRCGTLVRVVRPGTGGDSHISETALASVPVDFTIMNDSGLAALASKIDRLADLF